MIVLAAELLLAAVLLVSAALKLADASGTRMALATYGIRRPDMARAAWAALVGVELALAAAVAAGTAAGAWAAAALFLAFAAAQAVALRAGRAGAPCACFGARGRVGGMSLVRAAALAAAFGAVALLDRPALSTEEWLGIGLAAALLGVAALGVVVLALAREVGMLRLAVGPQAALELPHEGPPVGSYSALGEWFDGALPDRLALAVFTSEGCAMCRGLAPAVEAFGRDPRIELRTFDEVEHAPAWSAADVPGSPFAVVLDVDATVLAKGTFNTGAQLESVLAAAERRRAERPTAR